MGKSIFSFLSNYNIQLKNLCIGMEESVKSNPQSSIMTGRLVGEIIAKEIVKKEAGLEYLETLNQYERLRELNEQGVLDEQIMKAFNDIRYCGNRAAHCMEEASLEIALRIHRRVYEITTWYAVNYGEDLSYTPEPYREYSFAVGEDLDKLLDEKLSKIVDLLQISQKIEIRNQKERTEEKEEKKVYEHPPYQFETLEGSYLLNEISKLKDSSLQAVEGNDTFSEFKQYIHVKRNIQDEFIEVLEKVAQSSEAQLVMLCGSVGDGKSHLLSYIRSHEPKLAERFYIHNDATESFDPSKNSIDTLAEILTEFDDNHIEQSSKKVILAINLGVLNNFIESEYAKTRYRKLRSILLEANIFEANQIVQNYEKQHVNIISFSDYNLFELTADGVDSVYVNELLNKITQEGDDNIFYQAYLKDIEQKYMSALILNYKLLMQKPVRKKIVELVIQSIIQYKKIISTRELFNFIYEILVPNNLKEFGANDPINEHVEELLPNLLFDNRERLNFLEIISKMDPMLKRNEIYDQLKIDCNISDDIASVVNSYMDLSNVSFLKKMLEQVGSLYELNSIEESLLLVKTIIRMFYFFGKQQEESDEEEEYQNYLNYLYYYNKNRPRDYKELFHEVQKAIFNWKGHYNEHYICINELDNKCMVYEKMILKPKVETKKSIEGPLGNRFKLNIQLDFSSNDQSVTSLVIDYPLYKMITKINKGYCPNKHDRENLLLFDEFIDKLILNGHIGDEMIIREQKDHLIFRFELDDTYGEEYFKFERIRDHV